jgi:hypothetical protein
LILDSRTPTNEGNVFVPNENYQIFLNTSSPIKTVEYSGVIIERRTDGYVIKGYSPNNTIFKYLSAVSKQNDPSINVGGISENYVVWNSGKTYIAGQNVEYQGSYYRTKTQHQSTQTFDETQFAKLAALPLKGGREAFIRKQFTDTIIKEMLYGTLLTEIQDVVDFLLGYGEYLKSQGFIFDYFQGDNKVVLDWRHCVNEFLFWTTQNWAAGSVITLSPGAEQIKITTNYSMVDNIFDGFYGYGLFKADGQKLVEDFANLGRSPNEFSIGPKNTADGIYFISLPLVQKEHVVIIDNATVFGDVIFDQQPGYRQERIKILGYRTTDWDGSLNIPGFIFDEPNIVEWEQWQDYNIGAVVKNKEFYYSAPKKVPGSQIFDAKNWNVLSEKPEGGLYANFEYKTNQFADFYDLDSDNFDVEQQKMAQHLIGYQKRQYLQNIVNDDVSQYKFYQGFIQDKGSKNALTKLFDALASDDKDSLEFYEEWAIKDGQYGASEGFDDVIFRLDEGKFRLVPQPIQLVNSTTGEETDLIYRIKPYEVYQKSKNYDHKPLPGKYVFDSYTKNAGYVNQQDVRGIVTNYENILDFNFADIAKNAYIWVGNQDKDWTVYKHVDTPYVINQIGKGEATFDITVDTNVKDFVKGDIIGINAIHNDSTSLNLDGFYKIDSINNNVITVETDDPKTTEDSDLVGNITVFLKVRATNVVEANKIVQTNLHGNDLLWIDSITDDNEWAVYKNTNSFVDHQRINNPVSNAYGNIESITLDVASTTIFNQGFHKLSKYDRITFSGIEGTVELNSTSKYVGGTITSSSFQLYDDADLTIPTNSSSFTAHTFKTGKWVNNGSNFGTAIAVDDRNTTLLVSTPDDADGKVYVYNRPTNALTYTLTQTIEPFKFGNDRQRFGAGLAISPDGEYVVVGSPNASNVKTKYSGAFQSAVDYPKNSIVGKDQGLWRAKIDIQGEEDNIVFNSFSSVVENIQAAGLQNNNTDFIPALIIGDYAIDPNNNLLAFNGLPTNHILVRAPFSLYEGSGINDQVRLQWNSITYGNQDLSALTARAPFNGSHSVITDAFLSQEHTIQKKIDEVLYVNSSTTSLDIGDVLQTPVATGIVEYTKLVGAELLIYLRDVNGTFNTSDSLFRDDGDFIGEYVKQGPIDPVNTSTVWGGYWWIDTPVYTPTSSTTNIDKGAGLVYWDLISDSTPTGRYYYSSLDYLTTDISSQNTFTGYIRTLTYRGLPGAGGSNDTFSSNLYVMRAPKALSDTISPGDPVSVYVNQLPQYTTGDFKDLTTIGLSSTTTNTTRNVYDVWDGYINLDFTKTDAADNPFEPRVGDTVRDLTTGATAEVIFYQRNSLNATIFVKNLAGTFSVGDDYGQNAEIEFLGTPGDPDVNYQIDRVMGEIQFTSLGYTPAGIGKMLVFDSGNPISLSAEDNINEIEYWMYTDGDVLGIPRLPNPPSSINNDWEQVYRIPAESTGTSSGFTNQGLYTVYSRSAPGRYDEIGTYTVPEQQSNFKLGSNIKIAKNSNGLYRTMVHAEGTQTQSLPGRIYFIKTGTENNITYTWEYAKNKKYKGVFNESISYFTKDIVYRENPAVSGTGVLYVAKTNLAPGPFSITDWTSTDDLIDYVGFIPNSSGTSVINDSTDGSTVLDQGLLSTFGNEFDINKNGDVLIANALYDNTKPNQVVVYRQNNGFWERGQEIQAPDKTSGFGKAIAISDDGMYIAVSEPFNDDYNADQGKVSIYHQVNGVFTFLQDLQSPNNERAERFGWKLQYDGNKLFVTSRNADSTETTTFDSNTTRFDNSFTEIVEGRKDVGVVFVYEKTPNGMLFAQTIQIPDSDVNTFGRNIHAKQNHFYVGLETKVSENSQGQVIDFRIDQDVTMWETHRSSNKTVDVEKIKKIFLYNIKENELLTYLDYIDPIQGKVAGPAEQELTYKTYFDPAVYTNSSNIGAIQDQTAAWGTKQVGEVWWNLTTAKFTNPYQGSIQYATQSWNKVFQGNSIDIYEWVESDILPSAWDAQADTETGFAKGYSGKSLYGDSSYSTRRVYNEILKTFKTMYYFWVTDKTIVPNVEFRKIDTREIAQYITDPAAKGHRFVALISPEKFVLYNCEPLIKGTDVAINIQFWTIKNQNQNVHNQYQIVSEGLETSQPNPDVVIKWFDSLIGYDAQSRVVPDPTLSDKEKYGSLNRPRQSWFKNKNEALKQVIERVNLVLTKSLIIDDKDISKLSLNDPILTTASNLYDVEVETVADLATVGTDKIERAVLSPVIKDGKITDVTIINPGKGYRYPPAISISGNGTDAELLPVIDGAGKIISVTVLQQGTYYDSNTILTVRNFAVLVKTDETLLGKWALYERENRTWNRIRSQSYNVGIFWNYVDWYATGYNEATDIDYLINNSYELTSLDNTVGSIVKISNIGTGGWLLIEKISNNDTDDYTQNYKTIGRQNGTINFKNTLYDSLAANTGFDTISFDTKIFDSEPIKELRIILNTIKDDILIDELLVEFNKLFFASLRYVFAEQTYVDWAFKTSFIKAKHNVGKLREDITFNNDNLPSYEAYVKEVKPFATKIREYLSAYEGIDPTRTVTTDFDLPASYNSIEGKILPKNIKVIDDVLVGTTTDLETYPNKNWLDNSSYSIVSVKPVDGGQGYTSPPVLTLTGGGGTGTVLKTYLGTKGDVTKVDVVVSGSGYYSTPVISVNGNLIDGGRDATFSVELGNNPVRGITTTVKFDRTTGTYVYTQIDQTQTFTASGSQFEFNLNWPIDLKITDISVFRNNIEQLSNEYTYTNILDATASYERYYGQVSFTNKPDANDIIVINYKLSPDLYQAADRISNLYNPQEGQLGKELSQLMTGIDYGGVEVKSFGMSQGQGWDSDAWFGSTWDSYDNTYNDEIFELGDSTTLFNFSKPLETGVEYHVYRNNVRIDDPNFGTAQQTNPNALVQSITGAGQTAWSRTDDDYDVTNYVAFDEEAVPFGNTDVVIFRKSTSDGTFLPNEQTYDSIIQGGNLNYSTATGLESADITIDGDGFVTPTTSAGPEEQVPGQLLDTVDIKVFERPKGGGSQLVSTNYNGNGSKVTFDIGSKPLTTQSVFVKVAGNIQKLGEDNDYTIDFNNNTITLASAPAINSKVNIVTLGVSGTKIIDIDTIVADGSTTSFMTNVRYKANLQNIITMDGLPIENVVNKSKKADGIAGNALIKFAIPPTAGTEIKYVFFEDDLLVKNYSEVNIETITADGSSLAYDIALTPSVQQPLHFKTIVKAGNKIFNAGYNQRYITKATTLEYKIEEWQFPPGSLDSRYVEVYLNGVILDTVKWNLIVGASTVIRLKGEVQQQDGDILDVFVMTDGEYRFGYVDSGSRLFVKTPNQIYFDTAIAEGTEIQIFTFNNHDYQDIQRISYDVVDRINLVPGTEEYQKYIHLHNGLIKLNQEAIDAQYLWVSINGQLLTPSVDYFVTDNKQYVKIESTISENDVVQVVHFAASKTQNKFGWSQFKDMLNRTHYIRINNEEEVTLAKDLYQYDQSITVINGEALPSPVAGSTKPAIIMIDGERIEYFVRNGNVISQFRRGTLGTGVKNMYPADTVVLNISGKNSMPYKDETLTTIFTADGTSSTYELDFTPNNINEFEVFVAGKRLRKNSINNYIFNEVTGPVALDSPEGDETLSAEFTINSNQLVLTSTPIQNTKVIVVRKQGQRWSNPGIALADSDSNISRFLRAATVDLPR